MEIRFGQPTERAALIELQRRASLVWEETRAYLIAHPEVIQLPRVQLEKRRVRVAEIARSAVGFSVMLPHAAGLWELDGLFVEPAHWGKGIGRALVIDALDLARRQGARIMELTAHPRAEGFYEKVGFTSLGPAQVQFGSATRMRRVLAAGSN